MLPHKKNRNSASSFKSLAYFLLLIIITLISFSISRKYYFNLNNYRTRVLHIINLPALKFESIFPPIKSIVKENELEAIKIQLLSMQIQAITNEKISIAANQLLKNNFKQKNVLLIAPKYYSSNGFLTEVITSKQEDQEITSNMAVISSEGLYGRVAKVQNDTINIISIFNAFSRIPAYTKNSKIYGMAVGNGFDITFLYNNQGPESLIDEEEVFSSGENNLLIPDLPIGRIKKEGKKIYIVPFGKQRPPVLGIIQN